MVIRRNIRSRTAKIIYTFILIMFGLGNNAFAQKTDETSEFGKVSELFRSQEPLSLKMSYSNKELKFDTNDSTYIKTDISYQEKNGSWTTLEVSIRRRGNFRRKNCFNTPIKMKLKKSNTEQTLFEGNKKLKLVLPCYSCKNANDYIVKEYLAYKFYEQLAPYHFKTRLVNLEYNKITGNKTKTKQLMAILVEDIKSVAKRHEGNVFKRPMNAAAQDQTTSVQNALFQYMIGNTDFSTTYQHNEKQLFVDQKIRPVPYDFDMSGFVNADYAIVSNVQNHELPIEVVTERYYKGFQRDNEVFETVRDSFVDGRIEVFETMDSYELLFNSRLAFSEAKRYISSFFNIIEDDKRFQREIVNNARPMYKAVKSLN